MPFFLKLQTKIRPIFYICLMFVQCSLTMPMTAVEGCHGTEINQFLTLLASAEAKDWHQVIDEVKTKFDFLLDESSLAEILTQLKPNIMESGDLELIRLYIRAVRNHDALSDQKAEPVPCYFKHYQPPDFHVPDIHLTIDVRDSTVLVTSDLTIKRNSSKEALILDGVEHRVQQVWINGETLSKEDYKVTSHELIILKIPPQETFQISIYSEIDPFSNHSLEGMYRCGEWLTTQCESEGARRIFFTLDRPDVLSCVTTTILADKEKYPFRLSNGNLVEEKSLEDGRSEITWHDPFPKPSYLFACVLGRFSQLKSHFKTKSGKDVELHVYVEPGKESRAHYSLYALQRAMEFDEAMFDREYDLSCLKMVGIPDFNSGAMENKGLMIFNDVRLLVDPLSGTDKSFREIAHTIAHEYFHNWSGNRVTVRNWFEIALKEAFTDLRAMLFSEWMFGAEFIRPKSIQILKEYQFPEESSERGHPIVVESYVDAHSIYDSTTYIKGREIFRMLKNYIDAILPDGFRKVQNLYFNRYDGQAVSFSELLTAGNDVLSNIGKDLCKFERWFYQPGTPIISVDMKYDPLQNQVHFLIKQSCPHPQTGKEQEPFQIPFSIELLRKDGTILHPKQFFTLEEPETLIQLPSQENPIPVFLHGYSAPVILKYEYTLEELKSIINNTDDAYCRWEAAQHYSIQAFKEMMARIESETNSSDQILKNQREEAFPDLFELYYQVLENPRLSPLAKAQVLEIPSVRTLSQSLNRFDFEKLDQFRSFFMHQISHFCKPLLKEILEQYPAPSSYAPIGEQMHIRELRYIVLGLLIGDDQYQNLALDQYRSAGNFDDLVSAFNLCLKIGNSCRECVLTDFYDKYKDDKAIFNFWLTSQASCPDCTIDNLRTLEKSKGYDAKNPNHVRSILRTFIGNLGAYHCSSGEPYEYIVDKILEIASFNPLLAHNYIAVPAFVDFEKLPSKQKSLMRKALERLKKGEIPPQTRDLIEKILT